MPFFKKNLLLITLSLFLSACGKPDPNTLIIGTIAGPETELVHVAQTVAQEQYGLTIKIIEFNDYNLPNEALRDGTIDANVYQHLPYLKEATQAHGYDFEMIGKTFIYPTGIYSNRFKSLNELPQKAIIALPNDPSNEVRALLLLQQAGLITVTSTPHMTMRDIVHNPKNLVFKELDAAQLTRVLPDVDAAVINTNFALPAGLNPAKDALFIENNRSPYANLIVINRNTNKKVPLEHLVQALNSPEVKNKAKELFGDAAIPAW